VVFASRASNLAPAGGGEFAEIYVRDLAAGKTLLVSSRDGITLANGFNGQPRLSLDGNTVVFLSAATNLTSQPTNGHRNIYAVDLAKRQLRRISLAMHGADLNGDCFQPAVSANGSIVAFRSNASNLVESDTNLTDDVFVQTQSP
jgi:Tol biopolymer transport system component